jgi:hypothetical protein
MKRSDLAKRFFIAGWERERREREREREGGGGGEGEREREREKGRCLNIPQWDLA